MKKFFLRPLAAAAALAMVGPAMAVNLDFSGSNIYMKFLDGDQRVTSDSSGDTATGADQGQWTEFELRIKAQISKQVEAGVRIQSRSPAAYWTNFGFANNEGFPNGPDSNDRPQQSKFMKLRGAYVLLTPGYSWLDQALIGSSDWGMFDPFTIGQVRYIDRDNYNGFYFKGSLPIPGGSWEAGRLSLPNYLQSNYGQGPNCCSSDATQFNEAVYILQGKAQLGPAKITGSWQWFNDHVLDSGDTDPSDGRDRDVFARNRVFMLKGEGTVADMLDVKAAAYRSQYKSKTLFDQPWINTPKSSVSDNAFKLDLGLNSLPVSGLTVNYQYFNIGAGFYSNTAARRESDVLLTEGSEAAWHRFGTSALWHGGAAKDYQQAPSSAKCFTNLGGVCSGDSGLAGGANGLVDNDFMDFDEAPAESVQGWKGHTVVVNWEVAKTPIGFEYSRIGYNYNWQDYSPTGPLSNYFQLNNDRKTDILVLKASHVLPVGGGVELSGKYKLVKDTNKFDKSDATDDLETKDTGWTIGAGTQLFGDLYGSLSYGHYKRNYSLSDIADADVKKGIWSARFAYNLAGFEAGLLAQWINGKASLNAEDYGLDLDGKFSQYRMKAFVKAIF